jgi:hypothetical protein
MTDEYEAVGEQARQDLVVFMIRRATSCSECGEELWPGRLLRREGDKGLCLACADLDHLEFLPSGNAAVTRRAGRYSRLKAVVVRWSNARKRYERQGILAEPEAIDRADQESLADAEVRARRQARDAERREDEDKRYIEDFAGALRQLYPSCPAAEALQIARHACRRHSGRVGRTAAAKALDPDALRLAVVAHIRHVHTNYDELLSHLDDRESARDEVSDRVMAVLRCWQQPGDLP